MAQETWVLLMKANITCLDINCPERHGDACQFDIDSTFDNLVRDITKVQPMSKSEARSRISKLIALYTGRVLDEQQALMLEEEVRYSGITKRKHVSWSFLHKMLSVPITQISKLRGKE